VGLGTWQSDPGVVGEAVYAAVKVRLTTMSPLAPLLFFFPSSPLSDPARVAVFSWENAGESVCDLLFNSIVQAGYRHIDCARAYNNEKEVTRFLQNFESLMQLSSLFLPTRLIPFTLIVSYLRICDPNIRAQISCLFPANTNNSI
jgi:hypothetical protein